jgi:ABC-type multidrug transport system fused ATPase/permease subunit
MHGFLAGARENSSAILEIARQSLKADRRTSLIALGLTLLGNLTRVAAALAIGYIVTSAIQGRLRMVLIGSAALGCVLLFNSASGYVTFNLRVRLVERTGLSLDSQIMRMHTDLADVGRLESPYFQDQVQRLRHERITLSNMVSTLLVFIGAVAQVGSVAGILGLISPYLLILPVFTVPTIIADSRAARVRMRAWDSGMESLRLSDHMMDAGSAPPTIEEIIAGNLGDEITRRHGEAYVEGMRRVDKVRRQSACLNIISWLPFGLAFAGAVLYASLGAARHELPPGYVVVVVVIGSQASRVIGELGTALDFLTDGIDMMRRFQWLANYSRTGGAAASAGTREVPPVLSSGLSVRGLSFSYPGNERAALTGISFHAPPGTCVAIVGDNGAGKSTLVKILAGLYTGWEGTIEIDGTDLRSYPADQWQSRLSAAFEDYVKFQLRAQEAIGVGYLPCKDDVSLVRESLRRAGAADLESELPAGLETLLGGTLESGHEPSQGQWQRIGLARGMMRARPLLLLLDEPTASLDPHAEHDFCRSIALWSKEAGVKSGCITLFVSHRFRLAHIADLIIVLGNGSVEEAGSHDDLMALGGRYREMYLTQAAAFRT